MNPEAKLKEIERDVEQGRLRRASNSLKVVTDRHFPEYSSDVTSITGRLNSYLEHKLKGTLIPGDLEVLKNNIKDSFRLILDRLVDSDESAKPGEKEVSALRLFDFSAQIRLFNRNRKLKNSLFLIHGTGDCGQKWLYNRLIKLRNYQILSKPVPISLGSAGTLIEDCILRLGDVFAHEVFIPDKIMPRVVEVIKEKLHHEDVILIFERAGFDSDQLQLFYEKIWQPLKVISEYGTSHHLVGFLVEYQSMIDLETAFNQSKYHELIGLPAINELNEEAIEDWRNDCGRVEEHSWVLDFFEENETLCLQMLAVSKAPWRFMQRVCKHMNKDINLIEWLEH